MLEVATRDEALTYFFVVHGSAACMQALRHAMNVQRKFN